MGTAVGFGAYHFTGTGARRLGPWEDATITVFDVYPGIFIVLACGLSLLVILACAFAFMRYSRRVETEEKIGGQDAAGAQDQKESLSPKAWMGAAVTRLSPHTATSPRAGDVDNAGGGQFQVQPVTLSPVMSMSSSGSSSDSDTTDPDMPMLIPALQCWESTSTLYLANDGLDQVSPFGGSESEGGWDSDDEFDVDGTPISRSSSRRAFDKCWKPAELRQATMDEDWPRERKTNHPVVVVSDAPTLGTGGVWDWGTPEAQPPQNACNWQDLNSQAIPLHRPLIDELTESVG